MSPKNRFILLAIFAGITFKANAQIDRSTFHAAMESCFAEIGVTRVEGTRPSDEDRAKIDACLTAKGIEKPERGQRGGNDEMRAAIKACADETGVQRPEKGQRPSVEDRQKIEACLSTKGISRG
jgi:hypothetical protein